MADYDARVRVKTDIENGDLLALEKDFDKLKARLESLHAKGDKMLELGVDKQSKKWQAWLYDVAQVEMAMEDVGEAIDNITGEQSRGIFDKMKDSANRFFKSIKDGTKKSDGLLKTMNSRLKGIALSLLVFNWITKGFNAMVAAMKEGFQNLAQYSSDYNASMSALKSSTEQLKNSLAAAFDPLVNMAIPYLTKLVNWVNRAADSIAQFIAVLQGKNTYTKAKEQVLDYAASLESASKSAKRALASFDELNVVNKDGGTDNGALTGADAFEEVPIDAETYVMLEKAKKLLETILPLAVGVGVAIAAWKIAGFLSDLGSVVVNLKSAYAIILAIAGLVLMVSKYFNMWNDGVDWEGIKGYIAGVALAVSGLTLAFGKTGGKAGLLTSGIAGLVLAFKDMLEQGFAAENMSLGLISVVEVLASVFTLLGGVATIVVGIITAVIGAVIGMVVAAGNGEEALERLESAFGHLGKFLKNVFAGDLRAAFKSFDSMMREFLNLSNVITESIAECVIKALNVLIWAINQFSFTVPDWVPGVGGYSWTPGLEYIDKQVKLPRYAKGAVIPGGRPFAAILGDQPAGQTNVETPLSTIEQALQNVVDKNGGTGDINLTINLDGDPVYKSVVKRDRIYQKATGHSAFVF